MKKILTAAALLGSLLTFAPSAEAENLGTHYYETSQGCFKTLEYRDWVPPTSYRGGYYRYGQREVSVPCRRYTHSRHYHQHHHYHGHRGYYGGYYRPFRFGYSDDNFRLNIGW